MSILQDAKLALIDVVHMTKDVLHIHVGLVVFVGVAALLKWPLRDRRCWLAALAFAVGGEVWDLIDTANEGRVARYAANVHDIFNTMIWPTVLHLLARFTRRLRA